MVNIDSIVLQSMNGNKLSSVWSCKWKLVTLLFKDKLKKQDKEQAIYINNSLFLIQLHNYDCQETTRHKMYTICHIVHWVFSCKTMNKL